MIQVLRRGGAKVLLAGITLPRNYGQDYIQGFDQIYHDLARENRVPLIPFLLEGVATNPALMQSDGLHPTAEGAKLVAATVLKHLEPLLK
jgi:acyl-CoA thioesterase-1